MTINRREEFRNIANGTAGVPYLTSAWQHLVGHEYGAGEFSSAYVDFVRRWDWDWVKINPRAVYYSEAWGNVYDENDYGGYVIPKKVKSIIESPVDIGKIGKLDVAKSAPLIEATEAASLIRNDLPDRGVIQTVFSPLSVLLQIADLPLYPGDEFSDPADGVTVESFLFEQPEAAKLALDNIAATLADYAANLVRPIEDGGAGLDGIFYAVTGTVSDDYFDAAKYAEYSQPYDQIVLNAIKEANPDAVVLLHTCRSNSHPEWFDIDGVDVLQWDQFAAGNPGADHEFGHVVPVAGANFSEFGAPGAVAHGGDDAVELVRRQVAETLAKRAGKPFLLAPSCTVPTPALDEAFAVLSNLTVSGDAEFTNAD
ncbi:uroporphyrinogen decarboxylase family protein [Bifidobacterium choloepi]|uniref:Uroporphyrinogen decarboxylase n=1 Tax=Bifidobacterium choloepi TaxID=2614131 RepID=A0A6I5N0E6_9BIFI|nr:uroporphyrinogen decarboxylase family protein [Bifidobacterium choloepi]NEG69595.1 uroporphyrinogen decarboxylase [Bifidobacterium choloepi]